MTRLALLRHGTTAWNRDGRLQGRTDVPLDEDARAALTRLRLPGEWARAEVVASPLARAMQTAAALGLTARAEPALVEMNWGAWEGRRGAELRADPASGYRDIEHWGLDFRPPGGESVSELRARVIAWALGLERDTLAICHIGVMRALLAAATGWAFAGPAPFAVKRNRLYVLDITEDGRLRWDGRPLPLEPR